MEHGHGGHGDADDPLGKKVGVQAALLAVALAVVTILSHRAHTESVMEKADANDKWSYYQSTKIKMHTHELGIDMLSALGAKSEAAEKMAEKYTKENEEYKTKSKEIEKEAREKDEGAQHAERQAAKFDLGEGLLEIGLVLSSLYFISHKKMFPLIGILAGLSGLVLGVLGLLAH